MLSDYQLKIADLYNITIGNVKTFIPNFFENKIFLIHYQKFQLYLSLEPKLTKYISCIRIHQSQ